MIIKIEPQGNGGHLNQSPTPTTIPTGWAIIPNSIKIPSTFPFVNIKTKAIGGTHYVTEMTEGIVPEPEPMPEPEPTLEERLDTVETEVDEISQAIERGLSL